jgi:hypothetical protein
MDADEAIGLGKRKGRQEDAVDEAEDGAVGADAERKCKNGDDRKTGPPGERPDGQLEIPCEMLHDSSSCERGRTGGSMKAEPRWEWS